MGGRLRGSRRSRLLVAGLAAGVAVAGAAGIVVADVFAPGAPAAPSVTTLDTGAGAGSTNIISVGADGLPVIAYHAGGTFIGEDGWAGTGSLKLAACKDDACSSAKITTVANDAEVSGDIGLTIGSDGLPLITYFRGAPANDLVAVHCKTSQCKASDSTALVTAGDVGKRSSVAIDPFGLPIIAFSNETTGGVHVARCADVACSSTSSIDLVDAAADPADTVMGKDGVAIAVGTDGNPIVAYGVDPEPDPDPFPPNNDDVRVAHCRTIFLDDPGGGPWTYECADDDGSPNTKTTLGTTDVPGADPDIVIGSDGLPFVTSFFPTWHCESVSCEAFTSAAGGCCGGNTSPAVGPDGLITYLASDPQAGPLVPPIQHCGNLECSVTTETGIEGLSPASSLTIGSDGLPIISNQISAGVFPDPGAGLEVIHCTNQFCVPYFRRR